MYIATQCRQHHLHGTAIAPSTPDDAALPAVPIPLVIAFSSSVFILTASAASLSSFSQDTLASISEKECRITALQFHIGWLCVAYVALPQRSVPACLGRLEAATSHRILVSYAIRGSLDGVPTGPFRCAAAFLACGPCQALPSLAIKAHIRLVLKT